MKDDRVVQHASPRRGTISSIPRSSGRRAPELPRVTPPLRLDEPAGRQPMVTIVEETSVVELDALHAFAHPGQSATGVDTIRLAKRDLSVRIGTRYRRMGP